MSEYDPYWFKNMIERVKSSNDPTELIEAIDSHRTGLLANEQIREVIIESLKGNHLKKGRGRTAPFDRNTRIWADVTVMTKEGMSINEASLVVETILKEEEKEMIANRKKVGEEFAIKAESVREIYLTERKRRGREK